MTHVGIVVVRTVVTGWFAASMLLACGPGSEEARRTQVDVVVDATGIVPITSNLGYRVTLDRARFALGDFEFTTGGNMHALLPSLRRSIGRFLLPAAHAHPGHAGGGEILGELAGSFVVDWLNPGARIGTATLVTGRYQGANFSLRTASNAELPAGDPLAGHTVELAGTVEKAGRSQRFTALLAIGGAKLMGAPFDHEVHEVKDGSALKLGVRFLPLEPTGGSKTIFDGIDFHSLAGAAETIAIRPSDPAHNQLVRPLRTHDHYDVRLVPASPR